MKTLPSNFELERYGLYCRLVIEDDAEFIIKLRTDTKLTRFIHDTNPDIENQRLWIRKYKEREIKGEEYYFIYYVNGEPCGLNRLYDIKENGTFNGGSWVFKDSSYELASVAALCIHLEIAFDNLGLIENVMPDAVHENNKSVLKINKMFGASVYGEIIDSKGKYYQLRRTKEDFYNSEKKFLQYLKK